MSRHLVLVDLCWLRDKDPRTTLGHASLLSGQKAQSAVDIHSVVRPVNSDRVVEESAKAILEIVDGLHPEEADVAIGVYVWGEEATQRLLPVLRQRGFRGRIILGGPQVTYAGAGVDRVYPDADVFVRGYGEKALSEIVRTTGRPRIPGVHYSGTTDQLESTIVDLQALPSPWFDGTLGIEGQRFVRWETQRGCPYSCSFCQHREPGARSPRKDLGWNRLVREIDLFCSNAVEEVAVLDPVFNSGPRALDVLDRFASHGFRGRLSLQCRAETISDEFLERACALNVCLEFGLQTVIPSEANAVDRRNDLRKVEATLARVKRSGIAHQVSVICGLPEQTLGSFARTVAWCLERDVAVIRAFPLMLLRGTKLHRDRERWHLVESQGGIPEVIASSTFSIQDYKAMARIARELRKSENHHPSLPELLALAECRQLTGRRAVPPSAEAP